MFCPVGENPQGVLMEVSMKINGKVYTDKEWRHNQIGIFVASVLFELGFFLMIIFIR